MTLLVLGAGGQVGRALIERAGAAGRGFDRAACDICDEASVARALSTPTVSAVVNCAAYTAVDRAESASERAFAVNSSGAEIVARTAAARALPIIHLDSSNNPILWDVLGANLVNGGCLGQRWLWSD